MFICAMEDIPSMVFRGVRKSCDIFERKTDFASFANFALLTASLKIISFFTSLRVDSEHESLGLDASLHGESAYKK